MEKVIKNAYLNPKSPSYLAGINAVYREAKQHNKNVTLQAVQRFLEKQETYTLHKPGRRNFPRNRMRATGLGHWQADLADFQALKPYNKGTNFLLVVIDIVSKYGWALPLPNKKPSTVGKAIETILKKTHCNTLMTDSGKEFVSKDFQDILKKYNVTFFTAPSPDTKAALAERLIRTLKRRLYKHMTLHNTHTYIDVLPKVVNAYNNSVHSTTKMKPVDITQKNEYEVVKRLFGSARSALLKPIRFRYKLGDVVRISKYKSVFEKGYKPQFTSEVFIIRELVNRHPQGYRLQDLEGEPIEGLFYAPELSRVRYINPRKLM